MPAHTVPVLRLDELNRADAATDSRLDRNPQAAELGLTPQHLAYVIYTSG